MKPLLLDISFWQENPDTPLIIVDFEKMNSSDASGVIFRLGQGTWQDKQIENYWKNSEGKGLLRGGYWYYDNAVDPKVQAKKCADIINKYKMIFELPFFADFEDKRTLLPFHGWKHWFNFMEEVKRLVPNIKMGVYTGYYYWEENKPTGINYFRQSYFGKYPLWIAQYPYETHREEHFYTSPKIPPTWSTWLFWQVSDRGDGHFYGVESSRVDINYFNGSYDEFEKYFGKPVVPPETEEPPIVIPSSKKLIIDYPDKSISYNEVK